MCPNCGQRICGEQVIEHDVIHPVIPVLGADDLFSMCQLSYDACFRSFAADAEEQIEKAKEHVAMDGWPYDENGSLKRDDQLFVTVFPWFSLTAFSLTRPSEDSIPLLAYGNVLIDGDCRRLPVSVNFHHGLVDGLHEPICVSSLRYLSTRDILRRRVGVPPRRHSAGSLSGSIKPL